MKNPLSISFSNPFIEYLFHKVTKLDILKVWYDEWLNITKVDHPSISRQFLNFTLNKLAVSLTCESTEQLAHIPHKGPLIIIANHPLGGIEGMLLSEMLLDIRPDLRVLTNELLLKFPEFTDLFIGVDILNKDRQHENARGIRTVAKHLASGGAILIFPAGTVSHIKFPSFEIEDAPWASLVGSLAQKYHANCLPIWVDGKNSNGFYFSGIIHARFRTLLLVRAMLKKFNSNITIRIGKLIDPDELRQFDSGVTATDYLRVCCDVLRNKVVEPSTRTHKVVEIRSELSEDSLNKNLKELASYIVVNKDNFTVYCAPYSVLNCVMEQIAIVREKTFRAVDEGTGKELDTDRFDPYYLHLFVWDKINNKIAGGYRLAKVDSLLEDHGISVIYSRSLYDYDAAFIKKLGRAVEVGRSFVAAEYQRHPKVLDLLWQGIGAFMVKNPEYHTLFGCVSISRQYSQQARALLSETFLYHYGADNDLRKRVTPTDPLRTKLSHWDRKLLSSLNSIPIINKLLGHVQSGRAVPILIRHYLSLNGRFISFTIDNYFNQSLDGLILVDLRNSPSKYINRYFGAEGAARFREQWSIKNEAA